MINFPSCSNLSRLNRRMEELDEINGSKTRKWQTSKETHSKDNLWQNHQRGIHLPDSCETSQRPHKFLDETSDILINNKIRKEEKTNTWAQARGSAPLGSGSLDSVGAFAEGELLLMDCSDFWQKSICVVGLPVWEYSSISSQSILGSSSSCSVATSTSLCCIAVSWRCVESDNRGWSSEVSMGSCFRVVICQSSVLVTLGGRPLFFLTGSSREVSAALFEGGSWFTARRLVARLSGTVFAARFFGTEALEGFVSGCDDLTRSISKVLGTVSSISLSLSWREGEPFIVLPSTLDVGFVAPKVTIIFGQHETRELQEIPWFKFPCALAVRFLICASFKVGPLWGSLWARRVIWRAVGADFTMCMWDGCKSANPRHLRAWLSNVSALRSLCVRFQ